MTVMRASTWMRIGGHYLHHGYKKALFLLVVVVVAVLVVVVAVVVVEVADVIEVDEVVVAVVAVVATNINITYGKDRLISD